MRAAVDGDPRLVRQAAMVDPNTAATLTVEEIWALCDDLTEAHGDLLPERCAAGSPLGAETRKRMFTCAGGLVAQHKRA